MSDEHDHSEFSAACVRCLQIKFLELTKLAERATAAGEAATAEIVHLRIENAELRADLAKADTAGALLVEQNDKFEAENAELRALSQMKNLDDVIRMYVDKGNQIEALKKQLAWFEKRDEEAGHLLIHRDEPSHGAWLRWHTNNPKPRPTEGT